MKSACISGVRRGSSKALLASGVLLLCLCGPAVAQKVGAIQFRPSANPVENIQALVALVRQAAQQGAEAIVLPEHAFSGPLPRAAQGESVADLWEVTSAQAERRFGFLAKELGVWICLTLPRVTLNDQQMVVTSVLYDRYGHGIIRQRKVSPSSESGDGLAKAGSIGALMTADAKGHRIGVASADDLAAAIPRLAYLGAETVLVSSAGSGDSASRVEFARRLAAANHVNLAIAGTPAEVNGTGAAVISRSGKVVARALSPGGQAVVGSLPGLNRPQAPLGLPADPSPTLANCSAAAAELGRRLFFDVALSDGGAQNCASCHNPDKGFSGGVSPESTVGSDVRKAVSLLNSGYLTHLGWEGAYDTLEKAVLHQVRFPTDGKIDPEMERRLSVPQYRKAFRSAFGSETATPERMGESLAAYVRTLNSGASAADRHLYGGDLEAISESARRGLSLFLRRAGCAACHIVGREYALFTDNLKHDTGVGYSAAEARSKFVTPQLRGIALTAPYMHDGSVATLADVVDYYDRGGNATDPNLDPKLQPLHLSDQERADLIEFLKSLTGLPSPGRSSTVKGGV